MRVKNEYLIIGKIVKPFGIRGEVKIYPITDSLLRFKDLRHAYMQNGSLYDRYEVNHVRLSTEFVLLKFKGLESRTDAEKFRDKYIYVDRENAVELEDSSYFYYDLLDCKVITTEGALVGMVCDVQNAGSCDVYFVRTQSKDENELLIPAVSSVVKNIDIKKKEITIDLIDGLL